MRGQKVRTPEKRERLLEAVIRHGGNTTAACKECGIGRTTVFDWSRQEPEFKTQLDAAIDKGVELLEDEARQRAFAGWDEPVFHKGEVCGHIRKYSDVLLIFMLKAHRPEKYREHIETINRNVVASKEDLLDAFRKLSRADQERVAGDIRDDSGGTISA